MEQNLGNRWRFVGAALVMQLCLGVLYSWAVFRGPLATLNDWTPAITVQPYKYSLFFFTVAMIFAGFWQDKKGPKLVGSVGGILLGTGCLIAAFSVSSSSGLIFAYGILGGLGVGFAYVTPIATCVKWFPDKRGMIVGLAVMGFGAGSLIFAPLLETLIGFEKLEAQGLSEAAFNSALAGNLKTTFITMAVIFYICVIGAAQVYRVPPAGWKPEGWSPPATAGAATKEDFTPVEMLKTWQFWALWIIYFFGSATGQVAIGQGKPIVGQAIANAKASGTFWLTGGWTLGIMSAFNGLGRLFWGSLSDKLGRNITTVLMYAVYIITCVFIISYGVLNQAYTPILLGLCLIGFAYGGYLAVMPSFCADYYGAKNVGANYGILFSAWGISALVFTQVFAKIITAAKAVGTVEALAGGYKTVYYTLAVLSAVGLILAIIVKRPMHEVKSD